MNFTFTDEKDVTNLETYAISLVAGIVSLKTIETLHIKAIDIGILNDEQSDCANTILWDIRRLLKLYEIQLNSIVELIPGEEIVNVISQELCKIQVKKAKSMVRKFGKAK